MQVKMTSYIADYQGTLTLHGETMTGMPAYVISEVEVIDEVQGRQYRDLAAASVARHGGRYIVRGAEPEVPEGEWPPARRVVVIEFATMEQLHRWHGSAEYAEALAVRQTALRRRLLFVDGIPDEAGPGPG